MIILHVILKVILLKKDFMISIMVRKFLFKSNLNEISRERFKLEEEKIALKRLSFFTNHENCC